jgi:hypothetical protein
VRAGRDQHVPEQLRRADPLGREPLPGRGGHDALALPGASPIGSSTPGTSPTPPSTGRSASLPTGRTMTASTARRGMTC